MIGLTKALAGELAPSRVTANCFCPVGVPTTIMRQQVLRWKMEATGTEPDEIQQTTASRIPLGRNAPRRTSCRRSSLFLSDEAAFITGSALDVDGGMMGTLPVPGT